MSASSKAAVFASFVTALLVILRAQMLPIVQQWAASNQPLTLPQRILVAVTHGTWWLIGITVVLALILTLRSRAHERDHA